MSNNNNVHGDTTPRIQSSASRTLLVNWGRLTVDCARGDCLLAARPKLAVDEYSCVWTPPEARVIHGIRDQAQACRQWGSRHAWLKTFTCPLLWKRSFRRNTLAAVADKEWHLRAGRARRMFTVGRVELSTRAYNCSQLCYKLVTHACLFTDMCRFCLPLLNFSKNVRPIKRFIPCHEDKKYLTSFRLVSNTKCNISRLLA